MKNFYQKITSPYGALFLIIVAYMCIQFINLDHRWVDDESWYLMPIESILEEGKFRIPTLPGDDQFWPQPPILTYLEAFIASINNLTVIQSRLIPLICGLLLLWTTFAITSSLFQNKTIGVISVLYVASDNLIFLASRIVRPEILVSLFNLVTLLCIVRAVKSKQKNILLILAGISAAAAIGSHPNGLLAPVSGVILIFGLFPLKEKPFNKIFKFTLSTMIFILPFVLWIIYHDAPFHFENFQSHWLGRYGRNSPQIQQISLFQSILMLFTSEFQGRYHDFIQFPYRVHISIVSVIIFFISFFSKKCEVRLISCMITIQLFFFIFVNNSNPSVRYMATLTPLLCILFAYWTYQFFNFSKKNIVTYSCAILLILSVGVSQFGGNLLYLWKFRNADYTKLTQELRQIIPDDSVIYGGMAFWMGLRDHTYVPYMRTSWELALTKYPPNIVILDDWVMMGGGSDGRWHSLRKKLHDYVNTHGILLGEVKNSFYGHLKIYKISKK